MSSSLLRRSKPLTNVLRFSRVFTRTMGGGPRTFPGGLNKWQWKRMHEKKAKEKEKRLLDQEKQLYQARIRSEIRNKLFVKSDLCSKPDQEPTNHTPMTPQQHIKALADRFMKAGAEDLWNEDDGPLKSSEEQSQRIAPTNERPRSFSSPNDLRSMISDKRNLVDNNYRNVDSQNYNFSNHVKTRNYSVASGRSYNTARNIMGNVAKSGNNLRNGSDFVEKMNFSGSAKQKYSRNQSSSGEDEFGFRKGNKVRPFACNLGNTHENGDSRNLSEFRKKKGLLGRRRFKRNESSSSDYDSDLDLEDIDKKVEGWRDVKKMGSTTSLGKYDVKITKRVPLKDVEKESDFLEQVEFIRKEISKKKLTENGEQEVQREEESALSQKRFDECGISPLTVKALTAAGYVQMTRVQNATLSICLEGNDALVKAKTLTGKSAAFLLLAIETVLKATSSGTRQRVSPIFVLILCPTRELASQIAGEAISLLKYHDGIGVQTLVGGTRFKDDQKRLEADLCQILVATPGRLLDHIENKSGLSTHLMALKMLVLDEVDHLLDLGFRKDVEKIVDCLPRQRQSIMFSATIPKEVRRISQLVLKNEHAYIDTVGMGCVETPTKIKQSCLIAPHELHFQIVYHLLKDHIAKAPDYKVILFCSTEMVASLLYLLLQEMKMNVREIHSRKPQLYQTRVSNEFRESKQLILVTSDVLARGMNYPNVTLVVQVGIPSDREQYIHRLGITDREDKEGEGILLLAPWEEYFLDDLKDLPLDRCPSPHLDPDSKLQVETLMAKIDGSVKEAAYNAWLGFYNSVREIGRDKSALAELANKFAESIGLQRPPPLFRKMALKMGLKDIPGIRIRK
ncbi:probable DEAD-box ATP-dependent RNA helicase 48 [Mangifera indica]|uniref:probable DEAD-box ATP-dependent RNA helicase 48 n=1 Tax=Mangifera indica TaxID=29780 RepID=UPI001CFC3CBA|nr:probable DEAD-box ATP-dependent RNA helicase 48 [Mangifera indica]